MLDQVLALKTHFPPGIRTHASPRACTNKKRHLEKEVSVRFQYVSVKVFICNSKVGAM